MHTHTPKTTQKRTKNKKQKNLVAAVLDVVVVRDRLGADEALLQVGVDDACRLWRRHARADRPRARLLLARREVRL